MKEGTVEKPCSPNGFVILSQVVFGMGNSLGWLVPNEGGFCSQGLVAMY